MKKFLTTGLLFLSLFVFSFVMTHTIQEASAALETGKEFFDQFGKGQEDLNQYDKLYQDIVGTVQTEGADAGNLGAAFALREIVISIVDLFRWLLTIASVVFIVISGARMVAEGQNEDAAKAQLTNIRNIAIGIVVMHAAYFTVRYLFGDQETFDAQREYVDFTQARSPVEFADKVVFPLMNFVLGFLAAFTVLFIIIAAFRVITAQGDQEKLEEGKKTFINAGLGLGLILLAQNFVKAIYGLPTSEDANPELSPDVDATIQLIMLVANYILGFVLLLAVVMFIYAGILIIFGSVKEDQRAKGMKIAGYTFVGLIVIISSYAIISTIARLIT